jgi:type II secretory pathway component PulJ
MRSDRTGFTTVDCLVALVVFAIGVLGATATIALAIRAAAEGSHAARAARLLLGESATLSAQIAGAGGACAGATPGTRVGQAGLQLISSMTATGGGRSVQLVVTYPTVHGLHTDTANTFLPCF